MRVHVVFAIFKRNFVSYFSNPTGYVFLFVFVVLSGLAAFWPNEFFNNNLANLDQLNQRLPYIMLIFIPAITMSIWADERRQGTDELLLTNPASDFEVVLGKYLSAGAIFTASLLYSALCNFVVLWWLGDPDVGLFGGIYFGYWMVGMAMISIGMTASFITSNLTIGFLLGAAFNAPLVFAEKCDVIFPPELAVQFKRLSIGWQFRDFSRGVISLSSIVYFTSIIVVMLYVCMILIGRRHWAGGKDSGYVLGNYLARAFSLVVAAVCALVLLNFWPLRLDATNERLNSLHPNTRGQLADLPADRHVQIEAFITPESETPESYVQTRLNLVNMLQELDTLGGSKVSVRLHDTRPFTDQAARAEDRYGIPANSVSVTSRGAQTYEPLYLGVAMECGLKKLTIPFFDRGTPIEYELIRSISTVAAVEEKKPLIGLLKTGFPYFALDEGGKRVPRLRLLAELEKQYDLAEVDPSRPIQDRYAVLIAVQPSMLKDEQYVKAAVTAAESSDPDAAVQIVNFQADPALDPMHNFVDAIRRGQPTVVFEDPLPFFEEFREGVMPTSQPFPPVVNPRGTSERPFYVDPKNTSQPLAPEKQIQQLWDLLEIDFYERDVVWDAYSPHRSFRNIPSRQYFVFVGQGAKALDGEDAPPAFHPDDPISSNLQEMLYVYPGAFRRRQEITHKDVNYRALCTTSAQSGQVAVLDLINNRERLEATKDEYLLAGHFKGPLSRSARSAAADVRPAVHPGHDEPAGFGAGEIDVVLVADIDCLGSQFFGLRDKGNSAAGEEYSLFDNVTFALNAVDVLAGDERFVDIRKRRPQHRTLERFDEAVQDAEKEADELANRVRQLAEREQAEQENIFNDRLRELQARAQAGEIDQLEFDNRFRILQQQFQSQMDALVRQLSREVNGEVVRIERQKQYSIDRLQEQYKWVAVAVPPILPLLTGVLVFFRRRAREKEGVSERRLR